MTPYKSVAVAAEPLKHIKLFISFLVASYFSTYHSNISYFVFEKAFLSLRRNVY
jgi:hypothetical protein